MHARALAAGLVLVLLAYVIRASPGAAAAARTFPGSATGSVKSRPVRANAVDDAKVDARDALDRSCANLAKAMHARRGTTSNVRIVKVDVSDGRGSGWDATVTLSDMCTLDG
ncbi:hypothetical protein [Vulcanimicrobium alpinum]|uniref:hypothetical protein n=1 Tax=Vulcanimicrobium alpinum TaxID=3016050 RepID=UPI00295E4A3C|nr:hypothetical protein [Vulcanimicrobium alpinum]